MEKNLPEEELGLQTHLNIHSVAWVMLSRRHVIIIRFLQHPAVREKQLARTWPAEFATATTCCRPVISWSSFEARHDLSQLMSIQFWGKHLLKHLYDRIWSLNMTQPSKERWKSKEAKAMDHTLSDLQIKFIFFKLLCAFASNPCDLFNNYGISICRNTNCLNNSSLLYIMLWSRVCMPAFPSFLWSWFLQSWSLLSKMFQPNPTEQPLFSSENPS